MKKKIGIAASIIFCIAIIIGITIKRNPDVLNRLDNLFLSAAKKGDELTDPIHHMKKMLEIGTIKIEKVRIQNDYGYALVHYINNTKKTFERGITISCEALDQNGRKINSNRRSFFTFERGLIRPGFEGRVEVPVELYGMKMKSMSCEFYGE